MATVVEARLVDETRTLFNRGQYEQTLSRVSRALKVSTSASVPAPPGPGPALDGVLTPEGRAFLGYVRAAALTRLARFEDALVDIEAVPAAALHGELAQCVRYTRMYLLYRMGRVAEAAALLAELQNTVERVSRMGVCLKHLEAQIQYRAGNYPAAAECYEQILAIYEEQAAAPNKPQKIAPAATSIWSRRKVQPGAPATDAPLKLPPISPLDRAELLTNAEAAMALAGKPADAIALSSDPSAATANSFEMLYNAACASMELSEWGAAEEALHRADQVCRARCEAEEFTPKELADELATVRVQLAFLSQMKGNHPAAEESYNAILRERPSDVGAVAVASNNLAFIRAMDPKANLFDLLKRMKATSVEGLEHKLTDRQKSGMGLNRVRIMLQMGRVEDCRVEIQRLRADFPTDEKIILVHIALLVSIKDFPGADKVLQDVMQQTRNPSLSIHGAYAQVAVARGDFQQAAVRLKDSPDELSKKPATILTVTALFEKAGELDNASKYLNEAIRDCDGTLRSRLTQELARLYERHGQHEQAVSALDDLLRQFPKDLDVLAALVTAKSHFDLDAAEIDAQTLTSLLGEDETPVDVEMLEQQPPPAGTETHRPRKGDLQDDLGPRDTNKKKIKKSKKKRLPKSYDPNGPLPDPERWLPKKQRSTYRKKGKNRRQENVGKGTQGTESGAAATAAAEKLNAANPANASNTSNSQPSGPSEPSRPKGSKPKSKRRR